MPDEERKRNPHCSNCGDTRGGPVGHEISECTYDSRDVSRETSDVPPSTRSLINAYHNGGRQIT